MIYDYHLNNKKTIIRLYFYKWYKTKKIKACELMPGHRVNNSVIKEVVTQVGPYGRGKINIYTEEGKKFTWPPDATIKIQTNQYSTSGDLQIMSNKNINIINKFRSFNVFRDPPFGRRYKMKKSWVYQYPFH